MLNNNNLKRLAQRLNKLNIQSTNSFSSNSQKVLFLRPNLRPKEPVLYLNNNYVTRITKLILNAKRNTS